MRLRALGFGALAAAALFQSCAPACAPVEPAPAVEAPPPEISSITLNGQGSGHGRGMSAWGAYGWSLQGAPWTDILDYYYAGTSLGSAGNERIGVRLLGMDGAARIGVISTSGTAVWHGAQFGALQAVNVGNGTFNVYGHSWAVCPQYGDGWAYLGTERSTTFSTWQDETAAAPGDVLGLCQPNGSVVHYRGDIRAVFDPATGQPRAVNDVLVENYLKGVMSRELPSSWGNAGGGAGMNALWAFAVAQRSFALSQNRYPSLGAKTCDTATCQVYGGAAYRADWNSPTSFPGARVCETGNTTFECATTNRAIAETAGYIRLKNGAVVSTEYSASHGPYSAGISFPVRDDSISNVPGNPNYTWSRTVDAAAIEARWGLGNLVGAYSEPDPSSTGYGVWGYRIVLQGTDRTVAVGNLEFRNAFGFPSHGFSVAGANY
jgi:Stage II sporulation protein